MIPRPLLTLANQLFDLKKKLGADAPGGIKRNIRRMESALEEMHVTIQDPTGEAYQETRTDCEATISGTSLENLKIVETIKPIIRLHEGGVSQIVQRAVVIVEGKK